MSRLEKTDLGKWASKLLRKSGGVNYTEAITPALFNRIVP
jgi:hypothetical protein